MKIIYKYTDIVHVSQIKDGERFFIYCVNYESKWGNNFDIYQRRGNGIFVNSVCMNMHFFKDPRYEGYYVRPIPPYPHFPGGEIRY